MLTALKSEFIEHLRTFGLLGDFFKFLLNIANQHSASPEENLVSTLLVELRADYLRETVMTSNEMAFSDEKIRGAQVLSSEDGS